MSVVNLDAGTVASSAMATIEVSSVDDTAKMVARVALDRNVPAGKFAFRRRTATCKTIVAQTCGSRASRTTVAHALLLEADVGTMCAFTKLYAG